MPDAAVKPDDRALAFAALRLREARRDHDTPAADAARRAINRLLDAKLAAR